MTSVSTHILDTARGRPAAGVPVTLDTWAEAGWQRLAGAETGTDGRIAPLASFEFDNLTIDFERNQVTRGGTPVALAAKELEVGLMDHRRRLKGVVGALLREKSRRETVQLVVNEGDQDFES